MLSLLGAVADHLAARSVGHALIGAGALAAHGVSRSTSDLDLLKLFAGSPQDAWDVEQILAAGDREAIASAVEAEISRLPEEAARLRKRIAGG